MYPSVSKCVHSNRIASHWNSLPVSMSTSLCEIDCALEQSRTRDVPPCSIFQICSTSTITASQAAYEFLLPVLFIHTSSLKSISLSDDLLFRIPLSPIARNHHVAQTAHRAGRRHNHRRCERSQSRDQVRKSRRETAVSHEVGDDSYPKVWL